MTLQRILGAAALTLVITAAYTTVDRDDHASAPENSASVPSAPSVTAAAPASTSDKGG